MPEACSIRLQTACRWAVIVLVVLHWTTELDPSDGHDLYRHCLHSIYRAIDEQFINRDQLGALEQEPGTSVMGQCVSVPCLRKQQDRSGEQWLC